MNYCLGIVFFLAFLSRVLSLCRQIRNRLLAGMIFRDTGKRGGRFRERDRGTTLMRMFTRERHDARCKWEDANEAKETAAAAAATGRDTLLSGSAVGSSVILMRLIVARALSFNPPSNITVCNRVPESVCVAVAHVNSLSLAFSLSVHHVYPGSRGVIEFLRKDHIGQLEILILFTELT